jgi:hypothetical protein
MLPASDISFAEFSPDQTDSRYESVHDPSWLSHENQTALFKGCPFQGLFPVSVNPKLGQLLIEF